MTTDDIAIHKKNNRLRCVSRSRNIACSICNTYLINSDEVHTELIILVIWLRSIQVAQYKDFILFNSPVFKCVTFFIMIRNL